jgi:hypothetical protein
MAAGNPLAGARFCGNVQTLADFRPPGMTLGDMTLRDCSKGLGRIISLPPVSA